MFVSKRRKFSAEFKRGALTGQTAGCQLRPGRPELGIRDALLTRWKQELQGKG